MIIEHFIPMEEIERITELAVYNEELDTFYVPNIQYSGNFLRENLGGVDSKKLGMTGIHGYGVDETEEIKKLNQDIHDKIYYVYTEEGPVRED